MYASSGFFAGLLFFFYGEGGVAIADGHVSMNFFYLNFKFYLNFTNFFIYNQYLIYCKPIATLHLLVLRRIGMGLKILKKKARHIVPLCLLGSYSNI